MEAPLERQLIGVWSFFLLFFFVSKAFFFSCIIFFLFLLFKNQLKCLHLFSRTAIAFSACSEESAFRKRAIFRSASSTNVSILLVEKSFFRNFRFFIPKDFCHSLEQRDVVFENFCLISFPCRSCTTCFLSAFSSCFS